MARTLSGPFLALDEPEEDLLQIERLLTQLENRPAATLRRLADRARRVRLPRALEHEARPHPRDVRDAGHAGERRRDLVRGAVHAEDDALPPPEPRRELLRGALAHELAARDHDHALAERLDLGEDVAREEDRALAAEPAHQLADLDHLPRIEPDRRLVEDEDRRVAAERLREPDPLPVALRQACRSAGARPPSSPHAESTSSTAPRRSARGMRFRRATKRRYPSTCRSG